MDLLSSCTTHLQVSCGPCTLVYCYLCAPHHSYRMLRSGVILTLTFSQSSDAYCIKSQVFFSMRVYRLSSRIWYMLLVCTLCLSRFAIAVAFLVVGLPLTIPEFVENYRGLLITFSCLADAVDTGNAVAMCYWLTKAQKEINIKRCVSTFFITVPIYKSSPHWPFRSRRIIDKLIAWSIGLSHRFTVIYRLGSRIGFVQLETGSLTR